MNKKLIGFVIIIISLVSLGVWEFWGRETFAYETILVLKEPLEAGCVLEREDFTTKRVEFPSKTALKPSDMSSLIGMQTGQYVAEDSELRREFFCQSEYEVGEDVGRGLMALPQDWLLSYPQTLVRGDTVYLYSGNEKIGQCTVAHVRDSSNNEISFTQGERTNSTGTAIYIEVISDFATLKDLAQLASEGTRFTLVSIE